MTPEHFQKLADAGLDVSQIGVVMQIMAEAEAAMKVAEDARKAVARERVQKWREKQKADVTLPKHNGDVTVRLTRAEDSSSKKDLSGKEEKKEASPAARSRGSRIPDDFSPDISAAVSEGLSRSDAEREARTFIDYWRARPGKEALKLDWPATWRVWFRKRLEAPRSTAPPKPLTQGESIRNMAREKGIIDATGSPIRHLETSDRGGENPSVGDVIRLAVAGNHRW